jgi:hypothetical protein
MVNEWYALHIFFFSVECNDIIFERIGRVSMCIFVPLLNIRKFREHYVEVITLKREQTEKLHSINESLVRERPQQSDRDDLYK